MIQNTLSPITEAQQSISPLTKQSTIMRKHRSLLGKYIKCPRCFELGDETCRIYLEDKRYRTECVRCGYNGYLKTQHN